MYWYDIHFVWDKTYIMKQLQSKIVHKKYPFLDWSYANRTLEEHHSISGTDTKSNDLKSWRFWFSCPVNLEFITEQTQQLIVDYPLYARHGMRGKQGEREIRETDRGYGYHDHTYLVDWWRAPRLSSSVKRMWGYAQPPFRDMF